MFKCLLVATLIASLIFLIIDVIWLSFATKSFYRPLIGNLLADKPVMWAAALFYILYVLGMALVVIQPCVESGNLMKTLYTGFIFGLVAYGTYNLTNMAVLKGWSPTVTFVDMFWGGSLTAVSATSGLYIAKKILQFYFLYFLRFYFYILNWKSKWRIFPIHNFRLFYNYLGK